MKRARIDDVKIAIKNLPKKKQENVMRIAKTHGVSNRFVEIINNKEEISNSDILQKYIDEMKSY